MNEEQNHEVQTPPKSPIQTFSIPVAIIIAGALIAGAVLFGLKSSTPPTAPTAVAPAAQVAEDPSKALEKLEVVSGDDHIRGNPDAPIKIVEYSDTECPFCKRFHETMKQVMDEYGDTGKVAWVYRHFPLDQLHPKARKEAEALECAGAQGGDDAFWKYTDRLYEVTPSNDRLDPAELPKIAEFIDINVKTFNECLSSGTYAEHVADDLANAVATGGRGTPWSIFVAPDGTKFPINGAQPYEAVKQLIETALNGS
jgi:protein-disulfide isomerase